MTGNQNPLYRILYINRLSIGHSGIAKRHSSLRSPKSLSRRSASAGPIAAQVRVPGATTVWPASVIMAVMIPSSFARWTCRKSSFSSATLSTIFAMPSARHAATSRCSARNVASTLAWAACAASFPFGRPKSCRTKMSCLYPESSARTMLGRRMQGYKKPPFQSVRRG